MGAKLCAACRAARERPRPVCEECGGPKRRGRGYRLCEACSGRPRPSEDPERRRKPCLRCGGPKPPGHARRICDACVEADPPRRRGVAMPCQMCGGTEGKRRYHHYCDECHEVAMWGWAARKRAAAKRLPCRACRGVKAARDRSPYCLRCQAQRRAAAVRRCGCGRELRVPLARKCDVCKVAAHEREKRVKRERYLLDGPRPVSGRRRRQRPTGPISGGWLTTGPLHAAVAKAEARMRAAGDANAAEHLAEAAGTTTRTVFAWGGERRGVRATVADAMLQELGLLWWDVWERPVAPAKRGRPADVLAYMAMADAHIKAAIAFGGEVEA